MSEKQGRSSGIAGKVSDVSQKLKALRELIPPPQKKKKKAENLFEDTADYIVLLRTQVVILQKLIDLYDGPAEKDKVGSYS